VHPTAFKLTENCALTELPTPSSVCIPLSQHIGAPAQPVVVVGDFVSAGTLIGKAGGFVSANVYSSVSGKVTGFVTLPTPSLGSCNHVVIENDGLYNTVKLPALTNPSKEEIVQRVSEAGIVGMGGATFPTHVKLSPKKEVDTLIINAAECEPYITCDYRLLLEETADFLDGVMYLKKALGVSNVVIGIEMNKPEAIVKLKKESKEGIQIIPLKVKYPQGAEKQLIYAVTRRRVPAGGLPMDIGVVVDNVHTAYSVCRAVKYGEPCYRRAMTVSGLGINKRGNFWVRNGVSYDYIHKFTQGGEPYTPYVKVISGGPMMGFAQVSLNACTSKGSSSLCF
jgi:electron transport complex, RnfABCDGE type, C subunit